MRVWKILIVLLSMPIASVYADSLETMGGGIAHKDNPLVCIMEPHWDLHERFYDELLIIAYDSVWLWQSNLKSYTGGNWYMPMELVPYEKHYDKLVTDFERCNIFIEFSEDNHGQHIDNDQALGYAQVDFSKSSHQWAFIMIYTEALEKGTKIALCIGCDKQQEQEQIERTEKMLPLDHDAIKKVLIHELGHGLGLGHYESLAQNGYKRSTMTPTLSPFSDEVFEIRIADKFMLGYLYGTDGYQKPQPHWIDNYCLFEHGLKVIKCE